MSPDLNFEDALQAHPEWSMRDKQGNALYSKEEPRLFRTCMFPTYWKLYDQIAIGTLSVAKEE